MSAKTNHLKIGVFVLSGLAIFVAGLLAFGARNYFAEKSIFETYIPGDVEGLSVGSAVKLRGVPIGKVTRIGFTWNTYPEAADSRYVVVEFEVRGGVAPARGQDKQEEVLQNEINKGLRARVKGQGITGTSIVSLEHVNPAAYPPPKIEWKPRHFYVPSADSQFGEMLASIEKSLKNLERLDFGEISRELVSDLKGVEKLLLKLEGVDFGAIGTNANILVIETRNTNAKLQKFLDDASGKLNEINVASLGRNADKLLTDLADTNLKLQTLITSFDPAPLNETLSNTRQAIDHANDVLGELKQYPSGFLFGQPPPPAKSVTRARK